MSRGATGFILPAVFGVLVYLHPASAQQPPPGYQLLTAPPASGGLLITRRQAAPSAVQLLLQGFREVAPFFDRRPEALGGYAQTLDQYAEAGFRTTSRLSPITGVAFAVIGGGAGTLGFAFDSPATFAQSLPRLLQLAAPLLGPSGQDPTPALNWRIAPFPDGSGQMELPDGWHYTFAQKGMVAAMGPQGIIERAVTTQVMSRAGAARIATMYPPNLRWPGPVLDPTDPVSAFVGVRTHSAAAIAQRSGQAPERILRVIEALPVAIRAPGLTHAAYIDYEIERGGVWRGLALVILGAVMSDGSWMFYETYVSSPTQSFAQNLPVLVRIWNSALTARHVTQERLDNALNSLREAGEIWRQSTENRNQALNRMHNNWTEAFRGTRVVEDTRTGTRHDVSLGYSAEIVQRLNQQEGYDRYREIPLRDLNQ
jgi:hypothetical protein